MTVIAAILYQYAPVFFFKVFFSLQADFLFSAKTHRYLADTIWFGPNRHTSESNRCESAQIKKKKKLRRDIDAQEVASNFGVAPFQPRQCFLALCVMVVALLLVLLSKACPTKAKTCSPLEMNACIPAITTSMLPSSLCRHKVREQRPCLCGYLKDPNLKQYINSPNARKVASTCGVPFRNF